MSVNTNFMELHFKVDATTEGMQMQRELIARLWESFLRDDDTFHFLHELGYLLLRFERRYIKKYKAMLDGLGIEHVALGGWQEDSDIVAENFDFFADYFHWISVLALSNLPSVSNLTIEERRIRILERMAHCYLNIANVGLREDLVYYRLAHERSWIQGWLEGIRQRKPTSGE
jgi:hypothetical protein